PLSSSRIAPRIYPVPNDPRYSGYTHSQPGTKGTAIRVDKLDQRKIVLLIVPDHVISVAEGPASTLVISLETHLPSVEDWAGPRIFVPQCVRRGQNQIFRHEAARAKAGAFVLQLRDVGL